MEQGSAQAKTLTFAQRQQGSALMVLKKTKTSLLQHWMLMDLIQLEEGGVSAELGTGLGMRLGALAQVPVIAHIRMR